VKKKSWHFVFPEPPVPRLRLSWAHVHNTQEFGRAMPLTTFSTSWKLNIGCHYVTTAEADSTSLAWWTLQFSKFSLSMFPLRPVNGPVMSFSHFLGACGNNVDEGGRHARVSWSDSESFSCFLLELASFWVDQQHLRCPMRLSEMLRCELFPTIFPFTGPIWWANKM
jgi:hypothetical protein